MASTEPTSGRNPFRPQPAAEEKNFAQVASEMATLTRDYAKQEIQDPLKSLGSYVVWGGLAWLLLGLGCLMLSIGLLRALQTETGSTFTGSLSFLPYVIVLVTAAVVLAIVAAVLTKRKK